MSLALCFSNLASSFKACSFNLTFNSCSFCLSFAISIFSCLSLSCFFNFNLLSSSFLRILYWEIVDAILSKNAWIYFSKLKFILKFISGFREFWKLITFKIKFCFFRTLDFTDFFLNFLLFFFNPDLIFLIFLLLDFIFLLVLFFTRFLDIFDFFDFFDFFSFFSFSGELILSINYW